MNRQVDPLNIFAPVLPNNGHARELTSFFGDLARGTSVFPDDMRVIFLCYTNRSGSNYLAELLASDRNYNLAGEDLNWDTVIKHSQKQNLKSLHDYFSYLARIKAKSGVLLLKTAIEHIDLLGRTGLLEQLLPRAQFIVIERIDKLAQAISLYIAFATGKYTSKMLGNRDEGELAFDAARITGIIGGIAEQHKHFDVFFARNGLAPTTILYEHLVSDTRRCTDAISLDLGLSKLQVDVAAVGIRRQAGELNDRFRHLYLEARR